MFARQHKRWRWILLSVMCLVAGVLIYLIWAIQATPVAWRTAQMELESIDPQLQPQLTQDAIAMTLHDWHGNMAPDGDAFLRGGVHQYQPAATAKIHLSWTQINLMLSRSQEWRSMLGPEMQDTTVLVVYQDDQVVLMIRRDEAPIVQICSTPILNDMYQLSFAISKTSMGRMPVPTNWIGRTWAKQHSDLRWDEALSTLCFEQEIQFPLDEHRYGRIINVSVDQTGITIERDIVRHP